MKGEKFNSILKWASLGFMFAMSMAAIFSPFSIEFLFGMSYVGMAFYGVFVYLNKDKTVKWRLYVDTGGLAAAFISSLLFVIFKIYAFYFISQAMVISLTLFNLIYALIEVNGIKGDKRIAKNVLLICASVLSAAVFIVGAISVVGFGRGTMSTLAESVLAGNKTDDAHAEKAFLRDTATPIEPTFNTSLVKNGIKLELFEGMKVYYVNGNSNYDNVLFYIHGGYYVYDIGAEQITSSDRIASWSNSMVVLPLYTLAPHETAEINYPRMMRLYNKVVAENPNKKITLMGDSAGGGFALALAEGLTFQPDELILLSPWVDVTMSNPDIKKYYDPMLTVTMGKLCGEAWAGGVYPTNDWHISPIYGDLSKLGRVTIFVGTRELFYPDDTLLYTKIKQTGNSRVTLNVGKGLNHVFPIYPTLEGRIALEEICRIIKR